MLSVLALAGLVLARRRRNARLLGLLWLGASIMALGAVLHVGSRVYVPLAHLWDGVPVSYLMPYTWFVKVPGLSGFREPSRLCELGLVPAALLGGYTVSWVRQHTRGWARLQGARLVVAAVFAAGLLEAGMGTAPAPTMAAALPALDGPIAADHSRSVVLDVPFGLRGGVGITGQAFNPRDPDAGHRRRPSAGRRLPVAGARGDGHGHRHRTLLPWLDERPERSLPIHAGRAEYGGR